MSTSISDESLDRAGIRRQALELMPMLSVTAIPRKEVAMLCDDVRRVMYFFLDGAMGAAKEQDLRTHLNDCPDCNRRELVQRRLRAFVRNRVVPVAAPERLRLRLNRALRALCTE